ncbi:hypothetical protein AJ78_06986 [Emergomyces pasteurianus Ep9510]|uniref:C6 finger domain transcription factor nscR n=1 Tax=Emergomyces pasteurianus Ep9510 TaxID=1447872 RepID=A0A1J9P8L6_9EURO|nr:hypothetical protein AJ78_06986 [Emergomyces pasteurianus Ep9510]
MTKYQFNTPDVCRGRTYLLEINPNFVNRTRNDWMNMIDARCIDTSSGLFIDITSVRKDFEARKNGLVGALMCKGRHKYLEQEIFPLRDSYFEDMPAKLPYDSMKLLADEYGPCVLTNTDFNIHLFNIETKTAMEPSSMTSNASALPPIADSSVPPPEAPPFTANYQTLPEQGSSEPPPGDASSAHSIKLNPRSCITCRRRKVRCNKIQPCSNCSKANIQCVFPGPGRAPRKPQIRPDSELLARLRRLEGLVKSLGAEVNEDGRLDTEPNLSSLPGETKASKQPAHQVDTDPLKHPDPNNVAQHEVEQEFGRLVIGDGKSRYVEEMRDILGTSSDDEEEYSSPENQGLRSTYSQNHDGFLFGFASPQSLREFHPSRDQMLMLLDTYLDNVAPLLPIFHRPTIRQCFLTASNNLDVLNKNSEAALFSVYYAAITSMDPSQCLSILGQDRNTMLSRSRVAMEQAMARANILNSQSIVLLQAVVLFLLCVRRQDDSRYVWSMVAIVVRLAQGLGVHRDGTTFGLQPFETEMRRRLWWHICLLDFQTAEDHGCDPFIYEASYDTRIPLNINDDDICQESTETPEERVECTDLTFTLVRCEICTAARKLSYISPSSSSSNTATDTLLEKKEEHVLELNKRLEKKYVQYCTPTSPILWACATICRLAVSRMWLTIHQPLNGLTRKGLAFADDKHNRLFLASIEVLEFSCLLQTTESTKKWSWLFRTHMQWNSIAFLLSELCVRPISPAVDRAWHAINSVYEIWNIRERKGTWWRAINKLMTRAVKLRETRLKVLETQFGGDGGGGGGGGNDGATPESIFDPLRARTEGHPQYLSPALQAQGGIDKASELPLGINMGLNEMVHSPSDIQISTSATSTHQAIQTPFKYMPYSEGGEGVTHASTVGISPWLEQLPDANDFIGLIPDLAGHSSAYTPSWDDWDQVVHEFQMDIAKGVQTGNTNALGWFE